MLSFWCVRQSKRLVMRDHSEKSGSAQTGSPGSLSLTDCQLHYDGASHALKAELISLNFFHLKLCKKGSAALQPPLQPPTNPLLSRQSAARHILPFLPRDVSVSEEGLSLLCLSSLLPNFVVLYLAHKLSISAGELSRTPFTNRPLWVREHEGGREGESEGVGDRIDGKTIGEFWWCTEQGQGWNSIPV